MTEDLLRGIDSISSKSTSSKALEKVERAYQEFSSSTGEDLGNNHEFNFDTGSDDFSWM